MLTLLWLYLLSPSSNDVIHIWTSDETMNNLFGVLALPLRKDIFSKVRENNHFQTPPNPYVLMLILYRIYFFVKGETMKRNTIIIVGQRNRFTKDWVELEFDWRKNDNPSGKKILTIHMGMKMIKISEHLNIQANLEIRKILRISKSLLAMRNAVIIMNLKVSCENFKIWY